MLSFLPVGGIVFPSGVFIGLENVPCMLPTTAVQCPLAILIGCAVILVSGTATNMALRSSMCRSMPWVSCPSGQVTVTSGAGAVQGVLRSSTDTPPGAAYVLLDQPGMHANELLDRQEEATFVEVTP